MSRYYKFVDPVLENEIRNIIVPSIFPMLNINHTELLCKYVIRLINITAMCFGFYDDTYVDQLKQNNYQDVKWLIAHLLPFLNEDNDVSKIVALDEIYTKKKINCNINKNEPNYLYSNVQYNRFVRTNDDYAEYQFSSEDLSHNFYLLLNTVKTMANKMHVNWIDILPYTLNTYKSTVLYINTSFKMTNKKLDDWDPVEYGDINKSDDMICKEVSEKAAGLSMEDIYNTITIELYYGIKDIKWLIYDITTSIKVLPIIAIINKLFKLEYCLNGKNWDELSYDYIKKFNQMWQSILEVAFTGNDITYEDIHLSNDAVRTMLKGIIFSFDKSHSLSIEAQKEKYISIKLSKQYNEEDNDDEHDNTTFNDVINSLKSLKSKYVYEFFLESLLKLKNSWYGIKLLNENKTQIKKDIGYLMTSKENINITYKNIYNFAKSLCSFIAKKYDNVKHKEIEIYSKFPIYWRSLTGDQKSEIVKRLNEGYENPIEWFNVSRYIRFLGLEHFPGMNSEDDANREIHNNIKKILVRTIFESLITKGVLTQFIPNKEKTNLKYISRDDIYKEQKDVFSTSNNNPYWTSAYHYLTLLPYSMMKPFTTIDGTFNYFNFAVTPTGKTWYTTYSYDWVAQMGFCHHFVNNRVIFITGATGVGKSTEIPKLFLYYAKAIDYLQAPRVMCTQPRKAPTENNAEYVSQTLGVPIFEYNGKRSEDSKHYYIQMKHRDTHHIERVFHSVLEYSTDGAFILQVNDPILKTKRGAQYSNKNLYDIIMIDEAHEHKINMDMLLTLLKLPVTYNNSLRLVILSATMDEDESRYRRYYRDINDNRKYPLDQWIKEKQIDRINIDRRYHISPPGFGTRFKVDDIYEPTKTVLDMTVDVVKNSTGGDILVFQSGVADITELVNELNKVLPLDVIALPYHGQLNKDQRKFIETIGSGLRTLRISKTEKFANVNDFSNGTGSYKRAVIIATNAAEASITISSLKFVIETGTQKVQLYDYTKRGKKLAQMPISESSRIQRRGRVGRKSSGTVYYLYNKGKMENNKIAYEISTDDLSLALFSKLRTNDSEEQLIPNKYDPNCYNTKLSDNDVELVYGKNGLSTMIKSQYFVSDVYYDYYGKDKMYDYKNYKYLPIYYGTGFDHINLTDNDGSFYIVHPNELELQRNINGDITGLFAVNPEGNSNSVTFEKIQKYKGTISSKKIESFWDTLKYYEYVTITKDKKSITKTKMGEKFIDLFEELKFENHGLFRAMMYGLSLGCGDAIIKLVIMYQIIKMDVSNICRKINDKSDIESVKQLYKNIESDSDMILALLTDYHKFIEELGICEKLNCEQYIKQISDNGNHKFTVSDYISLLESDDKYTDTVRTKVTKNGAKKMIKDLTDELKKLHIRTIEKHSNAIRKWCDQRYLDIDTFLKYTVEYAIFRTSLNKSLTDEIINFMKDMQKSIKFNTKNKNTTALLYGFPFNVCKQIYDCDYYLSMYYPLLINTYKISSLSPYKPKLNTFVSVQNMKDYLLYLNINIEFDTISCLHRIDSNTISILNNIYPMTMLAIPQKKISESITQFIENKKKVYENDKLKNKNAIGTTTQTAVINYGKTLSIAGIELK